MKLYVRQIKPYIQPPCLQGIDSSPYPVEGHGLVSEDLEERLRDEIVVKDPWARLFFKERFTVTDVLYELRRDLENAYYVIGRLTE